MHEEEVQFDEDDIVRSLCRDSFYFFVQEFWSEIIQEEPIWNWHVKYLCDELQTVAERVFAGEEKAYDLIINISPGSTKSTIASEMYIAWVWTKMLSARFICASHGYPLAMDLSRKTRDVIISEKYKRLFPEVELREDQNAKGEFHNTKGGMRYAIGTGGSVIGRHAHFIMVDDPIDPTAAISEADLKSVNQWMSETLPTRKVNKLVTVTVLIMQRLHQNDPTGAMLEKAEDSKINVKHICLPAELTEHVNPPKLREKYIDGLMDPIRLSTRVLRNAEVELGDYGYAGQFLQSPTPLGGGMFKVDEIRGGTCPPIKRTVRYWDKAGTGGGGAYTVGVKMGLAFDGTFWLLDVERGQWEANQRERKIRSKAEDDGVSVHIGIEQEPGSGGKESAQNTVKRLAGFIVKAEKPTGDKTLRADPLAVQVNAGNFHISDRIKNTPMIREYLKEMKNFPYSKYKDQIDASSGAFNMLATKRIRVGGLG